MSTSRHVVPASEQDRRRGKESDKDRDSLHFVEIDFCEVVDMKCEICWNWW